MRDWGVNTVKFTGDENGNVKQLHGVRVGPPPKFEAIARHANSRWTRIWCCWRWASRARCSNGMIEQLGVKLDAARQCRRRTQNYMTLFRASSRRAISAAANRWWYGRLRKAAKRRAGSTSIWVGQMRRIEACRYAALCFFAAADLIAADDWRPLLNGKNLDGWEIIGDGAWT